MYVDTTRRNRYYESMLETFGFLSGFGFSLLVYYRSIRPLAASWRVKTLYSILTFIGITGTLFLSAILIAHFLRKLEMIR